MCTVALINAGVGRVVVAVRDPRAGALAPARLSQLAPLWPEMAEKRGMQIDFVKPQGPWSNDGLSIPSALAESLAIVFDVTRAELDEQLTKYGVLDSRAVARQVRVE
jgi:hypothetical protein